MPNYLITNANYPSSGRQQIVFWLPAFGLERSEEGA
jgi:hypothetical protein